MGFAFLSFGNFCNELSFGPFLKNKLDKETAHFVVFPSLTALAKTLLYPLFRPHNPYLIHLPGHFNLCAKPLPSWGSLPCSWFLASALPPKNTRENKLSKKDIFPRVGFLFLICNCNLIIRPFSSPAKNSLEINLAKLKNLAF